MIYQTIAADEQKAMLEARLGQYEREHYAHALNDRLLVSSGATDDATKAAIKAAEDAMATLDQAHAAVVEEIAALSP